MTDIMCTYIAFIYVATVYYILVFTLRACARGEVISSIVIVVVVIVVVVVVSTKIGKSKKIGI